MNKEERLETSFQAIVEAAGVAQEQAKVRAFASEMKRQGASVEIEVILRDGVRAHINALEDLSAMTAVQITIHGERGAFVAPLWQPKSSASVYALLRE